MTSGGFAPKRLGRKLTVCGAYESAAKLTQTLPVLWHEQRVTFGFLSN